MKTRWLAALGAALLAAIYYFTGEKTGAPLPSPELTELTRQVRRLEHQVAARKAAAPGQAPAPAVAATPPTPAVQPPPEPWPAEPPPTLPREVISLETRVETTFAGEDRDPAWAEAAANNIAQAWIPLLPAGSQVTDIDCRQNLCRVEINHSQVDNHRAAALSAIQNGVWPGPGTFTLVEADGAVQTVAYLGRPGAAPELWQE